MTTQFTLPACGGIDGAERESSIPNTS